MKLLAALLLLTSAACAKPKQSTGPASPSSSGGAPTQFTGGGTTSPTAPTECPSMQMSAPDTVTAGGQARVSVNVIDAGGTPTFVWTVTAGVIASGQGTSSITISTAGASDAVTATVELPNLPDKCATRTASATFYVTK